MGYDLCAFCTRVARLTGWEKVIGLCPPAGCTGIYRPGNLERLRGGDTLFGVDIHCPCELPGVHLKLSKKRFCFFWVLLPRPLALDLKVQVVGLSAVHASR